MWWCICSTGLQAQQSVVHGRYFLRNFQKQSNHSVFLKPGANTRDPVNYRPIINLNIISKILEHMANKQLQEHLPLSQNFNTFQSAYRSFHSTAAAMMKVVNDLLTAVNSGKPSIILWAWRKTATTPSEYITVQGVGSGLLVVKALT